MSLFDERSTFGAQYNFNQVGYNSQRQQWGTTQPILTRWVVQPKGTAEQALFGEIVASNVLHPPEVLNQLAYGVGHGIGLSLPIPQPGVTASVLNLGNQKYVIGAQILSKHGKYLYSATRAKTNLGVPLPSALQPAVKSAGGFVRVGGFCSQPDLSSGSSLLDRILIPGSLNTINPTTSVETSVEPISSQAIVSSRNICSIVPMSSATAELLGSKQLEDSARITENIREQDLILIDPVNKQQARVDIPTPTREQTFKLELLRTLQSQAESALGVETGRGLSYPALYTLAHSAWTDAALVEAFKLIETVESNPTFIKILGIISKINKYLPAARRLANILFPSNGNPSLSTAGTITDLGSLKIVPTYQGEIDRFNKFLPLGLQLTYSPDAMTLRLGNKFLATREIPFEFTLEFQAYVNLVNSYLPGDIHWEWGFNEPPQLLIICKGLAININRGLLVADVALDASTLVKQHLNCASADTRFSATLVNNQLVINSVPIANQNSGNSQLQTQLLSALPSIVNFKNGALSINPTGIKDLIQNGLNTALPPGLQLGLKMSPNGLLSGINLGPLQAKRNSATSWELSVPNATSLVSGISVLQTLGVIPVDLNFLRQAVVEIASVYAENKQDFIDMFDGKDVVGSILDSKLAKFKLDYSTGVAITQLPPALDEPVGYGPNYPQAPEAWSELSDVTATLTTSGFDDAEAIRNFTKRPTLEGALLPLRSFAESAINSLRSNNNTNEIAPQLGRSTSGVSIRDGQVPTASKVNYSLIPSLCANTGKLIPPVTGEGFAVDINNLTPLISGFEYTQDHPATPLQLAVVGTIDPQSSRDALEVQLIETGLGDTASRVLNTLDTMLYPRRTFFKSLQIDQDEPDDLIPGVDYQPLVEHYEQAVADSRDATERQLAPIANNFQPNPIDLIEVIQAAGNLPTQQILAGILVAAAPSATPTSEVNKIGTVRILERLDCQSLTATFSDLTEVTAPHLFPAYASKYGVTAASAVNYLIDPAQLLNLVDRTEPKLAPAVERLLTGDLAGFFMQLIWAKTGADIYNSPLAYLALQTNVRSYYGGAVPSSNPAREWLKDISK